MDEIMTYVSGYGFPIVVSGYLLVRIEERLKDDRQRQIELYAYLIMHNAGMDLQEKKRLILNLSAAEGKQLYRKNRVLYVKERLSRILRKS